MARDQEIDRFALAWLDARVRLDRTALAALWLVAERDEALAAAVYAMAAELDRTD